MEIQIPMTSIALITELTMLDFKQFFLYRMEGWERGVVYFRQAATMLYIYFYTCLLEKYQNSMLIMKYTNLSGL